MLGFNYPEGAVSRLVFSGDGERLGIYEVVEAGGDDYETELVDPSKPLSPRVGWEFCYGRCLGSVETDGTGHVIRLDFEGNLEFANSLAVKLGRYAGRRNFQALNILRKKGKRGKIKGLAVEFINPKPKK